MIKTGTVYENSAATLLDQVSFSPDVYAVPSDIASIVIKSFDLDSDALVKTTTLTNLTNIVLDSLSLVGWTKDKTGYNVRLLLDGSHWPEGDRVYRVEVKYIPATGVGDPIYSLWNLDSVAVLSE